LIVPVATPTLRLPTAPGILEIGDRVSRTAYSTTMRFRAEVELHGKTATGIEVPVEVVESLGAGKRVPVTVTINRYAYRTTIAPYSTAYFIPLSSEHRNGAGVRAGQVVDVDIERDTAPREVTVPDDLAAALTADATARAAFDKLAFTHRKEFVVWIESARKPETRRSRVATTVEMLREGRTRS
jgi:Bacteriocin-protection, YdeI or OmpD-Associated/Domain of unknown function (DUF1905)